MYKNNTTIQDVNMSRRLTVSMYRLQQNKKKVKINPINCDVIW